MDDLSLGDPFSLDMKSQMADFFATTMPCSPREPPLELAVKKTKKSKKKGFRKPSVAVTD